MTDEAPAAVPTTVPVETLPYPFTDGTHLSMYMWCVQNVMQHSETPLTPKTLDFIDMLYGRILQHVEGRPPAATLSVIK